MMPDLKQNDNTLKNTPDGEDWKGWVFYDEDCSFCLRSIDLVRGLLKSARFSTMPLQSEWAREQLGYGNENNQSLLLQEMKVVTASGKVYGGSEAVIFLARQFWWAVPLVLLTYIPGIRVLLDKGYKAIAKRRHCGTGHCSLQGKQDK